MLIKDSISDKLGDKDVSLTLSSDLRMRAVTLVHMHLHRSACYKHIVHTERGREGKRWEGEGEEEGMRIHGERGTILYTL